MVFSQGLWGFETLKQRMSPAGVRSRFHLVGPILWVDNLI